MQDYSAMKALVRTHKSALTRAKKKGPQAVLEAVAKTYAAFDASDCPWPDCWHLWESARVQAITQLRYR